MKDVAPHRLDGYLPIESYGVIGDGRTVVLIGNDGSIDWMCLPEIDAPSVFGALLDPAEGGSFSLAPAVPFECKRSYVKGTNVLQSEFQTGEGRVRVTEAMTVDDAQSAPWRELVRHVEGLSGNVPLEWRLHPRFEYGRHGAEASRSGNAFVFRHGRLQLGLLGWQAGEPEAAEGAVTGSFRCREGETAVLALTASDGAALPLPSRDAVLGRLDATVRLWRDWIGHSTYDGPWRTAVQRSLLALRLLADGRTGAITAAGTTSLPEALGAERNYDYRFGWIRDLSFTLEALLRVGMDELAHSSVEWLLSSFGHTRPRVDPVYALGGQVIRSQQEISMPGYRATGPVHVGNQAGSQLQLGGFGDLLGAVWEHVRAGHLLAPETGSRLADSLDLLCGIWRREDAGLWELGNSAHYATSKIGCWTAFERGIEMAEQGQLPSRHVERWKRAREDVRNFIEDRLWSPERSSYVMKAGSDMLDCGVLLASRRGYSEPRGERMLGTIKAIRSELRADGPLLYRYSGMQEEENAFLACSFWMVEALALAGRIEEASELMDQMVSLGSPLGLYTEEMEPGTHAMRGNFPQALTHLALVMAAVTLTESQS